MKRFFILIFTITTLFSTKLIGAEIIPEYFLMERLIMLMDVAPTYISIDGKQELKAMQIDKKLWIYLEITKIHFISMTPMVKKTCKSW